MNNGLNPQDVANSLTGIMRFLSKDPKLGWVLSANKPEVKSCFSGGYGRVYLDYEGTVESIYGISIDCQNDLENSIFEKQETFKDGEVILFITMNKKANYEVGRYFSSSKIYRSYEVTGQCDALGLEVRKIIKFNESLAGKVINE